MSGTCSSCTGRAELYLCPSCQGELRAQFHALAHGPEVNGHATTGLLDALADVALKRTCMGGGSGHRKRGDEMPSPFEPDTDKGRQTAQGRAAMLLDAARNTLTTIMRDVCESRGVHILVALRVVPMAFIGPLRDGWRRVSLDWRPETAELATWLARNTQALACDQSAGQWRAEIDGLTRGIEKAIDRPIPRRFCGPCTHYVEHNRHCGTLLYAQRNAIEVRCGTCRTTHNIEKLTRNLELRMDVLRFTASEILMVMQTLETPIPERSWQKWRKEGRVKIRGFKRPDNEDGSRGAIRLSRHGDDDEPVYRLSDVRKTWATSIRHSDALTRETAPV